MIRPSTSLLTKIGAIDHMRIHGLPLLLQERVDLINLTISREWWPADEHLGGYKLSFTSSIAFNFGATVSTKATLLAQLDLQTGLGRKQAQRAMGRKVVERHLQVCVTAIFDQIHRACYNYFYAQYKTVATRWRNGPRLAGDASLLRDIEDGLDEWRSLTDDEKLTFGFVPILRTKALFIY